MYEPLSTKAVEAGAPPTFFPPRRETSKFEGRQVGTNISYNNLDQNSFTHEINTTTNKVGASRDFESPVGQSIKNKAVPNKSNL